MAGLSRRAVRIGAGLIVVAGTIWVVGFGPFLEGLAAISPLTILLAVALAALATAAAAWRWRTVSRGFGLPLPWGEAFAAYYRSQFLNTVLPGGVVGDVHRAYAHGRRHERVAVAARAVAAERIAGQSVQVLLTLAVLLPLGLASPLAPLAWGTAALVVAIVIAVGAVAVSPRGRAVLSREFGMLRPLLARPLALLAIIAASLVVVAAHAATFLVAGLAVGVPAEPRELAVVALLVLAAAAIPISVGGWGPREAVSASAFALVGLGAGAGLAVSTAFGVLAMVAVAPGGLVHPLPRGAQEEHHRREEVRMSERPYVTLSCAMSIDGYLDSAEPHRLAMSNAEDLDRVDEVRARHDAIMVGASTVRRDDPRLLVRDAARRARRLTDGRQDCPAKVTVTASGDLSADAAFFTTGQSPRYVYCPSVREIELRERIGDLATVVGLGDEVIMTALLDDLAARRGVRSLMVEGGGHVLTQFLAADLVDELHLVVAPFFVGEARAPRAVRPGAFPWTADRRARLADTHQIGDVVLLRYALSDRFGDFPERRATSSGEDEAAGREAVTAESP